MHIYMQELIETRELYAHTPKKKKSQIHQQTVLSFYIVLYV